MRYALLATLLALGACVSSSPSGSDALTTAVRTPDGFMVTCGEVAWCTHRAEAVCKGPPVVVSMQPSGGRDYVLNFRCA